MEVVFHETLHFIFFEYCHVYCKEIVEEYDVNSGAYWELSEIWNVIILNQPEFQAILKRPEQLFYPHLKEKFCIVENLWRLNHKNIPRFVAESLKVLG